MSGGELLYVAVYAAQQLGVMLGVGSSTVLLCTHLLTLHAGEREEPHEAYARAGRAAMAAGLGLIIISGAAAVALHWSAGALSTLEAPAFLFKWALVIAALALFFIASRWNGSVSMAFAGGNWYALFLVHILAPDLSWEYLLAGYGVWMLSFAAAWAFFVAIMRWGVPRGAVAPATPAPAAPVPVQIKVAPVVIKPTPAPAPQPVRPPAPALQPVMPKTPPSPLILPKLPAMLEHKEPLLPKQIPGMRDPEPAPSGLPGLHIMPQKPEDIGKHERPAVVQHP